MSRVDDIMRYESGEMDETDQVVFFAGLIADGTAWQLQGHYGRVAASMIQAGLVDTEGNIL